jgi:hypothetical protein
VDHRDAVGCFSDWRRIGDRMAIHDAIFADASELATMEILVESLDRLSVAAIAVVAYCLSNIIHEGLGAWERVSAPRRSAEHVQCGVLPVERARHGGEPFKLG